MYQIGVGGCVVLSHTSNWLCNLNLPAVVR